MLSIQSHVVRGYVGNRAATFPLQVRLRNARCPRAPPRRPAAEWPQPARVTLAGPPRWPRVPVWSAESRTRAGSTWWAPGGVPGRER